MTLPTVSPLDLNEFDISPDRGFLGAGDPRATLSSRWPASLGDVGAALPKLLAARRLRAWARDLGPVLPSADGPPHAGASGDLDDDRCAARILSFVGHAYVWEEPHRPADQIPASVAVPWHQVLARLGRPPVLSYASYTLDNWRRLDQAQPIVLGNIVLAQNFFGGLDEEWFVLVHVEIEAKAGPALAGVVRALNAVLADDSEEVVRSLYAVASAEEQMYATLTRMPEGCDPYIYFNRVRPYIHGWKDNPALPRGVVYEGVETFHGRPQYFRGETGAQSSIIPSLDAAFGVPHAEGPLTHYLLEMRTYMPSPHRAFIERLEQMRDGRGRALLYGYVRDRKLCHPELWEAFCVCIRGLARFRALHYNYAGRYIHQQSQRSLSNPTGVGTGGTPFMAYLKAHLDETEQLLAD